MKSYSHAILSLLILLLDQGGALRTSKLANEVTHFTNLSTPLVGAVNAEVKNHIIHQTRSWATAGGACKLVSANMGWVLPEKLAQSTEFKLDVIKSIMKSAFAITGIILIWVENAFNKPEWSSLANTIWDNFDGVVLFAFYLFVGMYNVGDNAQKDAKLEELLIEFCAGETGKGEEGRLTKAEETFCEGLDTDQERFNLRYSDPFNTKQAELIKKFQDAQDIDEDRKKALYIASADYSGTTKRILGVIGPIITKFCGALTSTYNSALSFCYPCLSELPESYKNMTPQICLDKCGECRYAMGVCDKYPLTR